MWSVAQVLSLVTFVVCTCHPAVGHSVSLTLREQPKTKFQSDRMSGVHHRQEMKVTLLPIQQLSALVHENILKIKAKYPTYHQAVIAVGTLDSCKTKWFLHVRERIY